MQYFITKYIALAVNYQEKSGTVLLQHFSKLIALKHWFSGECNLTYAVACPFCFSK